MKRATAIVLTVGIGLGAAGAALALRHQWRDRGVQFESPVRGDVVEAVYGLGSVTANRVYQLKVGVTTGIKKMHVRQGQTTAKGAPLVELDDAGVQRAPFSGLITEVRFNENENVFPQLPIVTLVDPGDLYIVVSLEQQAALRIRAGQKATLSFESLRGEKFEGRVRTVYPSDGQFLAQIDASGLPPQILPGMTVDVAIEVGRKQNVLLVPVRALSAGRVIIERDGKRRKIEVKVGTVDGERAEVMSGDLLESDRLVVSTR